MDNRLDAKGMHRDPLLPGRRQVDWNKAANREASHVGVPKKECVRKKRGKGAVCHPRLFNY